MISEDPQIDHHDQGWGEYHIQKAAKMAVPRVQ
jgi:hypothetical protein